MVICADTKGTKIKPGSMEKASSPQDVQAGSLPPPAVGEAWLEEESKTYVWVTNIRLG